MNAFVVVLVALLQVFQSDAFIRPYKGIPVTVNLRRTNPLLMASRARGSAKKVNAKSRHTTIGQAKVSRILRDELSDIICSCDIKATVYPDEDLLRGVSVASIDFSTDLGHAKVHLSILGNSVEKRQVFVWLCNNMGQIRYSLSQRLKNLRRLPELKFNLVDSQSSFYLNDVMDEIAPSGKNSAMLDANDIDFEEMGDEDDDEW
eukprot:CAMPEP_0174969074 /NCGR_PEP_ID=MMETSP0004_2-20121128/8524_1 /TAXON_ID=420556 /ORGANISM="Ochromonas sp., Strain CCMP1393" /LENGTH=203 /DNA_ID=CAMNT_0016218451 /DNA_START=53 /DNA_END=664 /DNA_ORIENTATION=+